MAWAGAYRARVSRVPEYGHCDIPGPLAVSTAGSTWDKRTFAHAPTVECQTVLGRHRENPNAGSSALQKQEIRMTRTLTGCGERMRPSRPVECRVRGRHVGHASEDNSARRIQALHTHPQSVRDEVQVLDRSLRRRWLLVLFE
jgi:hypothetical protein